jgi:peptide deformylase
LNRLTLRVSTVWRNLRRFGFWIPVIYRQKSLRQISSIDAVFGFIMYDDLQIIFYPDPRLRRVSETVTAFDANLSKLASRMFELMRQEQGVGLAAPQVGVNLRLFVMNHDGKPESDRVIVNPQLLDAEGNELDEEGCLSLPKIRANIDRATKVTLNAQDLNGEPFTEVGEDFVARVWQHETDHLNGVMLIDRMGFTAKMASRKRLKELEADYDAKCRKE